VAHQRQRYITAMEVDGRLEDVLGLVLHDKECIRSTPLDRKEDKLGGSPRRTDLAATLRHSGGGTETAVGVAT
jgi:hypothetical protein